MSEHIPGSPVFERPGAQSRDRDAAGRPRSARPRDAQGRPLPYGSPGVPPLPEDPSVTPAQAVAEADRLLADGRPFAAHEVLEAAWKAAATPDRTLWQGLAQVAVGLTHLQRGNIRGAITLLRRGAEALAGSQTRPPAGIDVAGVRTVALAVADALADPAVGKSAGPQSTAARSTVAQSTAAQSTARELAASLRLRA